MARPLAYVCKQPLKTIRQQANQNSTTCVWTILIQKTKLDLLQADIQGLGDGLTFESKDEWQKVATQGLEALTENVKLKLPRQSAAK
jgi:hypothetical protein